MKIFKIISILLAFSFFNLANANIDTTCFKNSAQIQAQNSAAVKVQINSENNNLIFLQDGILVPYKIFSQSKIEDYKYSIKEFSSGNKDNLKFINDGNSTTYFAFDDFDNSSKQIILDMGQIVKSMTISPRIDIDYLGRIIYYISQDWIDYKEVLESNLTDFDFRYLKINFVDYPQDKVLKNTRINEIRFLKNAYTTYLVKSMKAWNIEILDNYDCQFEKIRDELTKYENLKRKTIFAIDSSTPIFDISFNKNSFYNNDFDKDWVNNDIDNCKYVANKDQKDDDGDLIWNSCDLDNTNKDPFEYDADKDGISDNNDNCKYISNPNQKDSNGDWFGDICVDDDSDGIIWQRDNCPTVANSDQKDLNVNGIGDACEFDKDKDWIFDSVDNCITTANPDQSDQDNDWIGDKCDNCKEYNPTQIDKNNNKIGDTCEESDKFAKENDIDKDWILDFKDNCPKIANPEQTDTDKDWIGDVCDNCIKIQNTDQKDEDKNWIGDICEDVDKDGIDWLTDNCPSITNPDQKDSDNNWVWDVCEDSDSDGVLQANDNCPYEYNPDQKNIDKDDKWDVCDTEDNRFMESNKWVFIGIMILAVAVFGVGIFAMIKKMK